MNAIYQHFPSSLVCLPLLLPEESGPAAAKNTPGPSWSKRIPDKPQIASSTREHSLLGRVQVPHHLGVRLQRLRQPGPPLCPDVTTDLQHLHLETRTSLDQRDENLYTLLVVTLDGVCV